MMQTLQAALPRRTERVDWSRLWWIGLGVLGTSVVVNLLVRSAVLALFPTQILTSDHIILLTVLGALGAILVFALVACSTTAQDERVHRLTHADEAGHARQPVLTLHIGSQLDPGIRRKDQPNEDTFFVMQGRLSHIMLYVDGKSKLANPLAIFAAISYTHS